MVSEDQRKAIDPELAHAPTSTSFVTAIVTKYGILGAVICFLGWSWIQKDNQSREDMKMLFSVQKETATVLTQSVEVSRRMVDYVERQERRAQ